MATMKEIAELSGVSRGTVDRVLNHRGAVNEETQKKVLEIAKLLNYQPNPAGKALAAQKKKYKIGVLLFGVEHPFFDEVMQGLREKAEELSIYGCTLLEKRIPFSLKAQLDAIDELCGEDIQGLLLSPYNAPEIKEKIDALWERNIPCITINTDLPHSKRLAYVGSDFHKCGRTAAKLLSLFTGARAQVGIVTGSHDILCHEERIAGFKEWITQNAPDMTIVSTVENEDDDIKSYDTVRGLLERNPDLTALYFTASGVSGGCRALLAANLNKKIPVLAFDALPSHCKLLKEGTVTAILTQQPQMQGATSLALLFDYLLFHQLPKEEYNYMELSIKISENI